MLKYFVFLVILAESTFQLNVTSFLDLVSIIGEWSHCCNDRFVPEYVWELVRNNTNHCLEKFPEDRVCFDYCLMRYFRVLDENNEFIRSKLLWYLGKDALLGDENDWKKNVSERFVVECLDVLPKATKGCTSTARKWGVCYWGKMFNACPAELGGGTCKFGRF